MCIFQGSGPSSLPFFFEKDMADVLFSLSSLCGCLRWETPKLYGSLSGEGIPLNKHEIHSNCKLIFNVASEKSDCLGMFVQYSLSVCAAVSQTPLFPTSPVWHCSLQCCAVIPGSVCYQRKQSACTVVLQVSKPRVGP